MENLEIISVREVLCGSSSTYFIRVRRGEGVTDLEVGSVDVIHQLNMVFGVPYHDEEPHADMESLEIVWLREVPCGEKSLFMITLKRGDAEAEIEVPTNSANILHTLLLVPFIEED
ncbi:hypothetical protein WAK64_16615 [Bacillus spongiae]|uniref:Uncharacterized protein n=1 Tax=Bacillus spongiae TaxID=2683610 RepID=A0ABU8HHB2_9BACI